VAAVAAGRDTTEAHIRDVGAGRIYSGLDGKEAGLVDEIGGLPRAVQLARRATGLPADELAVREVNPTSGALGLGRILPGPLGTLADALGGGGEAQSDPPPPPTRTFLRLMLEHQPGPLVLLPPGTVPTAE
jgi:protease-4